ncbi:coproporphyrinogen-III oxidase family protein [Azospirillum brasilense]|uniref:coproporphyrinogen-III oxidase family protein n=1 Tax=Azospirillum brasilense TaxID=192 RepID=UPI00190AAF8C|nr:coproporphyrinogen-III oxidase family protein [Azospirillum brasilense]
MQDQSLASRVVGHHIFAERESQYIRWYPKTLTAVAGVAPITRQDSRFAGIYIHVPFCDQLCGFCPFNKIESRNDLIDLFLCALEKEIISYGKLLGRRDLRFVYLGGGTPSSLKPSQIERILSLIDYHLGGLSGAEITLESHPLHLKPDYARGVRLAGVNRISSGIQSLDESTLRRIGAYHSQEHAIAAIQTSVSEFDSVAIDLLFRCRGQTVADWESQVAAVGNLIGVDHVSCYSLVLKNDAEQPSAATDAQMAVVAGDVLASYGFEHYASCASSGMDFARNGRKSVYEELHWKAPQVEFLGLGPGALGFVGGVVTINGLSVPRYAAAINRGFLPLVSATRVSKDEMMRRYFVLGVKTFFVELRPFCELFDEDPEKIFKDEIQLLERDGLAFVENDLLTLTTVGRLFVDCVSSRFFSKEERNVPHPEEPEIRRIELTAQRLLDGLGARRA